MISQIKISKIVLHNTAAHSLYLQKWSARFDGAFSFFDFVLTYLLEGATRNSSMNAKAITL